MFGASKFNRVVQHPGYNILSALIGAVSSNKASKAATKAADASAKAQVEAAKIAADEARFRPIDLSNAFGSIDWTYGSPTSVPAPVQYAPPPPQYAPQAPTEPTSVGQFFRKATQPVGQYPTQGYIPGSGYSDGRVTGMNLTPSAMVQGLSDDAMKTYQNYQGLLSQYFQPSLTEGGNQIYNEWQKLLAPTRQTQQSQLFDALQAKGITGIEGYDPLTGTATNPYAQSLFGAWGAQDAQMSSQAINEYISRLSQLMAGGDAARGSLVGVNELPINNVLNVSAALGGRNANAQGSSALMQGLSGAAQTQAQGLMASAANKNSFWQGLGNSISSLDWGSIGGGTRTPVSESIVYSGNSGGAFSDYNWTGGSGGYTSPVSGDDYQIGSGLGTSSSGLW